MDVTKSEIRDFIRIVFVCICWYIVSSSNGVLGKTILSQFPYPVTVTMVQLLSIAVWSPPLLKVSYKIQIEKNTSLSHRCLESESMNPSIGHITCECCSLLHLQNFSPLSWHIFLFGKCLCIMPTQLR